MEQEQNLLLVDEKDNIIGYKPKTECHLGKGVLHRAFSVFIFNSKQQLLIQKRSSKKMLWPLYWSNSCCSHPRKDESYVKAGERRAFEELGIKLKLTYVYKFIYTASYFSKSGSLVGSENELCAVLIGKSDSEPKLDPDEVAEFKWVSLEELEKDIKTSPEKYSPWFKLELNELLKSYKPKLTELWLSEEL